MIFRRTAALGAAAGFLLGTAAFGQAPTAAEAAAQAAGKGAAAATPAATPTAPATATAPAPATVGAPASAEVQGAIQRLQDRCTAETPDCGKAIRMPPRQEPLARPLGWFEEGKDKEGAKEKPFIGRGSPALGAPGGMAGASAPPEFPLQLSAFFVLGGSWLQEDPTFLAVGRNNGFSMAEARLEVTARASERLWLYLSLDGAAPLANAADPLQTRNVVELKDAYAVWAPLPHLRLQAGQFKAPQNGEALLEETELRFPSRSLATDGLRPPQGYAASGLSLGRQLGAAVGTDAIPLPFGWVGGQVALTNGNGPNATFNDTRLPSVAGRVALGLLDWAVLGADAYFQPRASGTQPELYRDDLLGFGADLRVDKGPAHLLALVQVRRTRHLTSGAPDEQAVGFSVEGGWRLLGWVEPVARYAQLDPSDLVPAAKVGQLDLGVNLYAPGTPVRFSAVWAHRVEQTARALANDGLDLALQVRF